MEKNTEQGTYKTYYRALLDLASCAEMWKVHIFLLELWHKVQQLQYTHSDLRLSDTKPQHNKCVCLGTISGQQIYDKPWRCRQHGYTNSSAKPVVLDTLTGSYIIIIVFN